MMVRPPEDPSALVSGAPRGPKMIYDEEIIKGEMEQDAPDFDEAIEDMKKRVAKLEIDKEGKSAWPQVSGYVES